MPELRGPVRCFLCNELVDRPSESHVDPIGVFAGEGEMRFWGHLDCMRAVASPAFRFPSDEDVEALRREADELDEDDSADDFEA
jgi:hypothetical protein